MKPHASHMFVRIAFQCSSASRKFLNRAGSPDRAADSRVSVLFSEPKIPQLRNCRCGSSPRSGFSALQRAENSSILRRPDPPRRPGGFSALQRAENSSMVAHPWARVARLWFQCSSASRKFLNRDKRHITTQRVEFQCSSASRKFLN